MKATLLTLASLAAIGLMGCSENGSNPIQSNMQAGSAILKTPGGGTPTPVDSRGRGDSLRVEGTITAVDTTEGTVTIGTRVIQTNAQTRIERNDVHVPLSAIQVGDRGEARIPGGSMFASRLEAESSGGGGGEEEMDIEGTVTAVDSSAATLTIGTTVVQTDSQTRIERNHSHVPLSAIQVGDRGEARIPAGSTIASRVEAESEHH